MNGYNTWDLTRWVVPQVVRLAKLVEKNASDCWVFGRYSMPT